MKWVNEVSPILSKSKTSSSRQWGTPSQHMRSVYPRGATIMSMFGGRGIDHDYKCTDERTNFMKNLLEETDNKVKLDNEILVLDLAQMVL